MICVSSVSPYPAYPSLYVGDSLALGTTICPQNATNKNVKWTSSNTNVATVTAAGLLKAVSVGTAMITATAQDGSGEYGVSLLAVLDNTILVRSVAVSPTSLTLVQKESKVCKATVSPAEATNKNVTWSSSNTNVATVTSSGLVYAQCVGTASIIAMAKDGSGKYGSCNITVTSPIKVSSVELNASVVAQKEGWSGYIPATVCPETLQTKGCCGIPAILR